MRLKYKVYLTTKRIGKTKTRLLTLISAIGILIGGGGGLTAILIGSASALVVPTVCNSGCTYSSLQTAVNSVPAGGTVDIESNLTLSSGVTISKSVTIDGNGYTISPTFAFTNNENNASLMIDSSYVTINNVVVNGIASTGLHGINIYESTNVFLNSVTVENNSKDGVVVNGSNVTVNNITTRNNAWGGIDVDQGTGVTDPAVLTVNGISHQSQAGGADIVVDDIHHNVQVNDTNKQYSATMVSSVTRLYTLIPTAPTAKLYSGKDSLTNYIPSGGYTNQLYFTFLLSSQNVDHYQLKYWNNISGSPYKATSPWSPTNLSGYTSSPANVNLYIDQFTQGQGTHYFEFSACNFFNYCTNFTQPYVVTYDTTPPVISILKPTSNTNRNVNVYVSNVGPLTISGTAVDNLSGIAYNKLTLYVKDLTTNKVVQITYPTVMPNGSWGYVLPAGTLTTNHDSILIGAGARDGAWNPGSDHVYFTVDDFPTNKSQCMNNQWKKLNTKEFEQFKNQGQCVSYVNHNNNIGKDNVHYYVHEESRKNSKDN